MQDLQMQSVRQNNPPANSEIPQSSQKKGSHHKNSTLPNAAVLLLNEILHNQSTQQQKH